MVWFFLGYLFASLLSVCFELALLSSFGVVSSFVVSGFEAAFSCVFF